MKPSSYEINNSLFSQLAILSSFDNDTIFSHVSCIRARVISITRKMMHNFNRQYKRETLKTISTNLQQRWHTICHIACIVARNNLFMKRSPQNTHMSMTTGSWHLEMRRGYKEYNQYSFQFPLHDCKGVKLVTNSSVISKNRANSVLVMVLLRILPHISHIFLHNK